MSSSAKHSATLRPDQFLADMMQRPALILSVAADSDAAFVTQQWQTCKAELSAGSFVYCKVPPAAAEAISALEDGGFRLVDTNVLFSRPRRNVSLDALPAGPVQVRTAEPADEQSVCDVAQHAFVYSRFHQDPHVEPEIANRIKAAWVGNFFNGQRGDAMVVAEHEDRIIGFNQLLVRDNALTIDLIAVDSRAQRLGAARAMMRFAESLYPNVATYRVGTQLANAPSISLYQSEGFVLESASHVLHYHHRS